MALTERQKNAIEYRVAHPNQEIRAMCKAIGIGCTTWYDWRRIAEFNEALDARLKEIWEDARVMAQNAMMEQAESGSFQATKYILDNLGYGATQKIDVKSENTVTINIGIEDGSELKSE